VVNITAAATGLVIVALQIAYLPALYDTFNRRETLVTLLESRAGTPAWGPELLARHQLVNIQGNLPALYADWERWSGRRCRDPHHLSRSPIPAFPASPELLDRGADRRARRRCPAPRRQPRRGPAEARLCMRMGFTCLRDIARVAGIPFDPTRSLTRRSN